MKLQKPKTDAQGNKYYEHLSEFNFFFETGFWADFYNGEKWRANMPFLFEADDKFYIKRTPKFPDKVMIEIFARQFTLWVPRERGR